MSGEPARQYVSSVTYLAHGAVGEMRLNGYRLRESYVHSADRLQMQELKVEQAVPKPQQLSPSYDSKLSQALVPRLD